MSEVTRRGYGKESLVRWRKPICPLVAGLTREQGEFILYGVTQAAAAAGAPLADAPSILRLFADAADVAPPTMSPWDRAFLNALYRTPQRSRFQSATIAKRVVRDVAPR